MDNLFAVLGAYSGSVTDNLFRCEGGLSILLPGVLIKLTLPCRNGFFTELKKIGARKAINALQAHLLLPDEVYGIKLNAKLLFYGTKRLDAEVMVGMPRGEKKNPEVVLQGKGDGWGKGCNCFSEPCRGMSDKHFLIPKAFLHFLYHVLLNRPDMLKGKENI